MLLAYGLGALIAHCAPGVGPVTMGAVVTYESGGRPNAIGDNTTRRSYDPPSRTQAIALASSLLALGHNLDLGYAQINSVNVRTYGLNVAAAFDPCTNLATGATILRADYARAVRTFGPGQIALAHALSTYNAGSLWSGLGYARAVYATAGGRFPGAPRRFSRRSFESTRRDRP